MNEVTLESLAENAFDGCVLSVFRRGRGSRAVRRLRKAESTIITEMRRESAGICADNEKVRDDFFEVRR